MDPPPPLPLPPVDLLSSLPEHLQDEILTRLDLRDAVHTFALSRAWRRRWETMPGLALSLPDSTPASVVYRLLRRWRRIRLPRRHDTWLIALSRRSVESISIFNKYRGGILTLQSSIFSCDNQKRLPVGSSYMHSGLMACVPISKL
jgi:hypothetical protein